MVCHGIPDARPLEEGDIVNLDVTVYAHHKGVRRKTPMPTDILAHPCAIIPSGSAKSFSEPQRAMAFSNCFQDAAVFSEFCWGCEADSDIDASCCGMPHALGCAESSDGGPPSTFLQVGYHGDLNETYFVGQVDKVRVSTPQWPLPQCAC